MADFYGTEAAFTDYCEARQYDIPAGAVSEDILAALLVASEWLDARYVPVWLASGTFKTGGRAQVREWPREGYVDVYGYPIDPNSVPREIENATYEAALRQLVNPGSLMVDYTPGKYKQVSVDGAISVTYADFNGAYDVQLDVPIIDGIIAPLVNGFPGANLSGLTGHVYRV